MRSWQNDDERVEKEKIKKGKRKEEEERRKKGRGKGEEESREARVRHTDDVGCIYRRESSTYVPRGCSSRCPRLSRGRALFPRSFFSSVAERRPPPSSSPSRSKKHKSGVFWGGETVAKKGPGNTASNRVNCAAYAFISLFRDNLLIVSTKRDKPPCTRVRRPVFRWPAATPDTLAAAPDARRSSTSKKDQFVCGWTLRHSLSLPRGPLRLAVYTSVRQWPLGADPREQRTKHS